MDRTREQRRCFEQKRKLLHNIRKKQLKFQKRIIRKEEFENLILNGHIEGYEVQRKAERNIFDELENVDGRTEFTRNE